MSWERIKQNIVCSTASEVDWLDLELVKYSVNQAMACFVRTVKGNDNKIAAPILLILFDFNPDMGK